MKKAEEIGFATFLVIVFAVFVILAWGYPPKPRIVPLTLSIPGLAFSLLHLGNSILKAGRSKRHENSGADQEPFISTETRKILEIWAWFIGLAVGINFLGFMIAIPAFIFAFIRFFAKRTWKLGAVVAASFTLVVYLLFYVVLKTTI